MKRRVLVVMIVAILTVAVQNLTENNPGVESLISPERPSTRGREDGGASLQSREGMRRLFNADRKRFGEDFRSNLLKHVGHDVERHYIYAQFLLDEQGTKLKSDPELALLLLAKESRLQKRTRVLWGKMKNPCWISALGYFLFPLLQPWNPAR